jgi:starch synthase (maltosyl-transferring)
VCTIPVALGWPPAFDVRDLLTGDTFTWRAGRNYVRLAPGQAHVVKVLT